MRFLPKLTGPVLTLAAFATAVAGLAVTTHAQSAAAVTSAPFSCAISVSEDGFGYSYAGVVTADRAMSGSYELSLSKTGGSRATVNQSGPFRLAAGDKATLGKAMLGRTPPEDVDATLRMHVDGKTFVCGAETDL